MSDETRVVLLKPGDVLLIGGVDVTPDNEQVVRDAIDALGLRAMIFADDIEIESVTADQLRSLLDEAERDDA